MIIEGWIFALGFIVGAFSLIAFIIKVLKGKFITLEKLRRYKDLEETYG